MVFTKKWTWKMAMAFKIFMRLAVCYLGISRFLLAAAIPATRSLSSSNEIKSLPELKSLSLDGVELIEGGATYEVERRMDVEKMTIQDQAIILVMTHPQFQPIDTIMAFIVHLLAPGKQ